MAGAVTPNASEDQRQSPWSAGQGAPAEAESFCGVLMQMVNLQKFSVGLFCKFLLYVTGG